MSKPTIPLNFILILSFAAVLLPSHSVIPSRYDGFVYKKPAASTATVLIEAFYDPVCPDSRDSWPPLKQAVDHYGPAAVSLIVHTFPLPYHDNAFVTSRALHIVNELNASATYRLLTSFFKHQYGCSRGVYGTPFFFVNGFLLPVNDDDTLDYNGWRKIIDPLITEQQQQQQHHGRSKYPSNVF